MTLLFFCFFFCAQEPPLVSTQDTNTSPRAVFQTLFSQKKAVFAGDPAATKTVLNLMDLSELPSSVVSVKGPQLARRLYDTLDRLQRVDLDAVPDALEASSWVFWKEYAQVGDKTQTFQIAMTKDPQTGVWRFSSDTVAHVDAFFQHVKTKAVVFGVTTYPTWLDQLTKAQPWLDHTFFFLKIWHWLALALIIFLATLIERTLFHWSTRKLVSLINRSRLSIEVRKPEVFTFPLRILTYGLALRYGLIWMDLEPATLAILANASHILLTVGTIWLANIAVHLLSQLLEEQAKKTENKFDDLLVPLFRKTAKILIWVAGILLIAKTIWGDIDTILAGFGLGGLAVALAAKDTLANLFGSITVLVDRPFQIGDWVQIGALDGTVEEVGFRSTRIRTFYNSLITIPNSQLTSSSIDNFGARQYRRFKTTLGVTYDTSPDRIEAFCEGIRQLILQRNHTRKDYFHVYLNDFGPSSLNILLYLFFEVPDWSTELAERHRIMIDIIRLAQSLDVQFAFPTQTLHVFQEEFQKPATIGDDPYVWGAHQAKTINQNPLTMSRPRSGIGQGENFPPDQPKTQS